MSRLRLALCQARSDVADVDTDPRPSNLSRAQKLVREAGAQGAQLAIFGEVYLNGYRSDSHLAEYSTTIEPPDSDIESLIDLSRETGVWIVMGLSRYGAAFPGNLFNSNVLISPDGLVGHYDKVHLANFVLPDGQIATEMVYWDIGYVYRVFDTPWCRIGLQICRDVRYPEASRVLTLLGAELIINSTAAPVVERPNEWRVEHFSTTRAVENHVWFAMVGVLGDQRGMRMTGNTRLVAPTGELVVKVEDFAEELVIHDIDLDEVRRQRALSHVLDRRVPSAYGPITATLDRDSVVRSE